MTEIGHTTLQHTRPISLIHTVSDIFIFDRLRLQLRDRPDSAWAAIFSVDHYAARAIAFAALAITETFLLLL